MSTVNSMAISTRVMTVIMIRTLFNELSFVVLLLIDSLPFQTFFTRLTNVKDFSDYFPTAAASEMLRKNKQQQYIRIRKKHEHPNSLARFNTEMSPHLINTIGAAPSN